MSLEHPNKSKKFKLGYLHNARPAAKSHRFEVSDDVKKLANEMRRLVLRYGLKEQEVSDIIKKEFGEGVGGQTTRLFLNDVYGPGFRPREKTLDKYKYFVWFLMEQEKQFANPKK